MVMHARKLPRLNDGYYDRNSTHPYENAAKYSKSPFGDGSYEKSPAGNDLGRGESPDGRPSPRYHNKSSYSQRLKEQKREHSEGGGSIKSPLSKERNNKAVARDQSSANSLRKSSTEGPSSRSNHDRSHAEESEKRVQIGDWSEHISSSGKKYYYNCKTEVSQWEKPKEWIDWEKQQGIYKANEPNRNKERQHDRHASSSSSGSKTASSEKHSNSSSMSRNPTSRSQQSSCRLPSSRNEDHHQSGRADEQQPQQHSGEARSEKESARHRRTDGRKGSEDSQAQDMDISPDTNNEASSNQVESRMQASSQPQLLSPSQVNLANLPKLMGQLAGTKGLPNLSELSPKEALRTIQQALQLTKQVTSLAQLGRSPHASVASHDQKSPQLVQVNHSHPQPTVVADEKEGTSPASDCSTYTSRQESPTSSISSLHSLNGTGTSSLASAVLKPTAPSLTPTLANYFREDLITHVTGWQADHAERQATRYGEEAHNIGSLNCTRVSAELKMARSLVRLAEIQSTLQEQRILFLRQQVKELEDRRSQNSFISDT